jgi:hypothetical protein
MTLPATYGMVGPAGVISFTGKVKKKLKRTRLKECLKKSFRSCPKWAVSQEGVRVECLAYLREGDRRQFLSCIRASCKSNPIRSSIPHHEWKFSSLQLQKSVPPEVSKGEKDFCKRLIRKFFKIIDTSYIERQDSMSCGRIAKHSREKGAGEVLRVDGSQLLIE